MLEGMSEGIGEREGDPDGWLDGALLTVGGADPLDGEVDGTETLG